MRPAGLHLLLEAAAHASTVSGRPELPAAIGELATARETSKLTGAARRLVSLSAP
jgi:hypothetical protein